MLESFNNETENGKLYISYPMVEALRDFEQEICGREDNCFIAIDLFIYYKNISSEHSANPHFKEYDINVWKSIIDVFAMRVSCLFGEIETFKYEQYIENVNPSEIYVREEQERKNNRVFVLSAFPEFLVDYFGVKLWHACAKHSKNRRNMHQCSR